MLPIYLAALAFGLVLIGFSVFAGDGSGDSGDSGAEGGAGHELSSTGEAPHEAGEGHGDGHGHEAGSAIAATLLSLRFWTYALGAFGMAGTALHLLGVARGAHLPVAVGLGVVVGGGASWLFRGMKSATAGLPASEEGLLGQEAEVVLPLLPGHLGKVRLRVGEQDLELVARAGPDEKAEVRDRVIVVRFLDGVAEVRPAPWKE